MAWMDKNMSSSYSREKGRDFGVGCRSRFIVKDSTDLRRLIGRTRTRGRYSDEALPGTVRAPPGRTKSAFSFETRHWNTSYISFGRYRVCLSHGLGFGSPMYF